MNFKIIILFFCCLGLSQAFALRYEMTVNGPLDIFEKGGISKDGKMIRDNSSYHLKYEVRLDHVGGLGFRGCLKAKRLLKQNSLKFCADHGLECEIEKIDVTSRAAAKMERESFRPNWHYQSGHCDVVATIDLGSVLAPHNAIVDELITDIRQECRILDDASTNEFLYGRRLDLIRDCSITNIPENCAKYVICPGSKTEP